MKPVRLLSLAVIATFALAAVLAAALWMPARTAAAAADQVAVKTPTAKPPAAKPAPSAAQPKAPAKPAAKAPAAGPADSAALVKMADEVAREVEALRGWKFKDAVRKQTCSPEYAREHLEKEIAKQVPADKIERIQGFLRLVGLLPPQADLKKSYLDILQEQAGGFYDSETKTLYMVDQPAKAGAAVERIMVAHELTHALDDQQIDFEKTLKPLLGQSEDQDLALQSVIEGSATALMMKYMTQAALTGQLDPMALQAYAAEEAQRSQALTAAPRYFQAMIGTYLCGMQFLAKGNLMAVMMAPDNKAVGAAFTAAIKDPPRSTEQILHPEKYWNAEARDNPVEIADEAVTKLLQSPGRWVVHTDTVGEMLAAILTTPAATAPNIMAMQMSDSWTNAAAKGWGGDRFYLVSAGPTADAAGKALKDPRGLWITLWDTTADRDEFVAAYEQAAPMPGRTTFKLGSLGAVFFFNFPDADRQALEQKLQKSPPKFTQNGKAWTPWEL